MYEKRENINLVYICVLVPKKENISLMHIVNNNKLLSHKSKIEEAVGKLSGEGGSVLPERYINKYTFVWWCWLNFRATSFILTSLKFTPRPLFYFVREWTLRLNST